MIVNITNWENTKISLTILFSKTLEYKRRFRHGKELIDTTCRIFWGDKELACETARQSYLDAYNKIVGKKIALTRAIAAIPFLRKEGCPAIESIHRKINRQTIWMIFHKTFGRWN